MEFTEGFCSWIEQRNKVKYLSPCGILGDQLLPAPNQRPGKLSSLFMSAQRVDRFANPRFLIYIQ